MPRKKAAAKKQKGSALEKKLAFSKRSYFKKVPEKEQDLEVMHEFAEGYLEFLSTAKTERQACDHLIAILEANKFKQLGVPTKGRKPSVKPGSRFYVNNRGKAIAAFVVGEDPIEKGLNIIAAHLDSPRLDLKQNPLFEDKDTQLSMLRTHYYGGIKKYQWASIPLALHGVVVRGNGTKVDISIGEDEKDPVFTIPDLLPHLAKKKQYDRKLPYGIRGEELLVLLGSVPDPKAEKEGTKNAILQHLKEKYDITEEDLVSAELQFVPAGKARYIGFDKMLIGCWGQDDKVSAYAAAQALMQLKTPKRTSVIFLFDKEEIGSEGPTAAQSAFVPNSISLILERIDPDFPEWKLRKALANSNCLSTDVKSAINPIFPGVQEPSNAAKLHYGITMTKYTGARGKARANDASAEYVGMVRRVFNEHEVRWQPQESGKVDEGGGGTVAKFLAVYDMDVIDSGVPMLAMHSIFEVIAVTDLYEAYRAYQVFMEHMDRP